MAFQSDFQAKRTWDPESGWELFDVTRGPGHRTYQLRHAQRPTLDFWCKNRGLERLEGTTHLGAPRYKQKQHVHFMSADIATNEQRQLIHDALHAYGSVHNGPLGPLELTWDEPVLPQSKLMTLLPYRDGAAVAQVARSILDKHANWSPDASDFLSKLIDQAREPAGGALCVTFTRDRLSPIDVARYVEELRPFWLALFDGVQPNPHAEDQESVGAELTPLVRRVVSMGEAIASDNIVVLLQDSRLDASLTWHVNPAGAGRLIVDAYEF